MDAAQVLPDGQLQALSSWVDLGLLRSLPFVRGGITGLSNNNFLLPETLSDRIWEAGDYYIAVWGHNGAFSEQPYALRAEVQPPTEPITPAIPIAPVSAPPPPDENIRALIVTNADRLETEYDSTRTAALTTELEVLAQAVSGMVVYLEGYADITLGYDQWDNLPQNPLAANYLADVIKFHLEDMLTSPYPNVEYIVVVGDDNIVPFYRVPDSTLISNERGYNALVDANSPMGARLKGGYILSDNFYASYNPLPWQGRDLFIPDYAVGRLVETPEEMIAAIDAYLNSGPVMNVNQALVTGYDFVIDGANGISATLAGSGVSVTGLITDGWSADQVRPLLLVNDNDFISLNGHFNHHIMVAGDGLSFITATEVVSAATEYTSDFVISIGCQSGLNVPAQDALSGFVDQSVDFAQSFVGRGAAYIANTGYGYGDSDAVGYSEVLAQTLTEELLTSESIGHALMQAKQSYYADAAFASFGDYDEKVLLEWTLYGLPMWQTQVPGNLVNTVEEEDPFNLLGDDPAQNSAVTQLISVPLHVTSTFASLTSVRPIGEPPVLTDIGNYYQVSSQVVVSGSASFQVDGEFQINPGRPIQPQISIDLRSPNMVPQGALFLSGNYTSTADYDPVVSRVVSDTASAEPPFSIDQWYPVPMHLVHRFQLGNRFASEKLAIIPAQYRATTAMTGTERLYGDLDFTIYYAPIGFTNDFIPPTIKQVGVITTNQVISFNVVVSDLSGVARVVVAYDDGQGSWQTFDLTPAGSERWTGEGPPSLVQAFVQAVDVVGNVALGANKGIYFSAVGLWLDSPQSGSGGPGTTVSFKHTLTNLGGGEDTFAIQAATDSNWVVQASPTVDTLQPGISTTIAITVAIPLDAVGWTTEYITVTAVSLTNAAVSQFVVNSLDIMPRYVYLPVLLKP